MLETIIALRAQKKTSKEIMAEVGMTKYTYEKFIKDNGLNVGNKIIWTPEQEQALVELKAAGKTVAQMCQELGFKKATLEEKLSALGLTQNKTIKFSAEDIDNILKLAHSGSTQKEIAARYSISVESLQRHLKKQNLSTKKYKVRHDYFETIDTEEKAYFLGLMYADGSNTATQNQIKLKLLAEDSYILTRFAQALTYGVDLPPLTIEITENSNMRSLQISSPQICSDLTKWGCMQSKSHILEFPTFLNEELMRHFIRGYFDGDGSIFNKIRPRTGEHYAAVNFTGNIQFITAMKDLINNLTGSNVNVVEIREAFQTTYTSYEAINSIRDYLYTNIDDTLKLTRKYNKFPSEVELLEKKLTNQKLSSKRISAAQLGKPKPTLSKISLVIVVDNREKNVEEFKSFKEASAALGIDHNTLRTAAFKNHIVKGRYEIITVQQEKPLAN